MHLENLFSKPKKKRKGAKMGKSQLWGYSSQPPASAPQTHVLTAFHHAHFVTLAQPAGLAALPPVLVDGALVCSWAHVVIMS